MQPIANSPEYKDCLDSCHKDNYIDKPETMIAFGVAGLCALVATIVLLGKGCYHRRHANMLETRLLSTVQDLTDSDHHKQKALKNIGWGCFCSLFPALSITLISYGAITLINCEKSCSDQYS